MSIASMIDLSTSDPTVVDADAFGRLTLRSNSVRLVEARGALKCDPQRFGAQAFHVMLAIPLPPGSFYPFSLICHVLFDGTAHKVSLSTGPYTAGTHWYQCRLLMEAPIAVNAGQAVSGLLEFQANDKYSYDIKLTLRLEGTSIEKVAQFSLADQYFAYYSGTDAGAAAATPAVESAWASGDPYAGTS